MTGIGHGRKRLVTAQSIEAQFASARRFQALGRLKVGEMNKSEARYEHEVLKPAMIAGDVLWYRFEGIKLRLADKTFLTPDFAVLTRSMALELHDVKGSRAIYMDDAKVKMKVAADTYPITFKLAFPPKRRGEPWEVETV